MGKLTELLKGNVENNKEPIPVIGNGKVAVITITLDPNKRPEIVINNWESLNMGKVNGIAMLINKEISRLRADAIRALDKKKQAN